LCLRALFIHNLLICRMLVLMNMGELSVLREGGVNCEFS